MTSSLSMFCDFLVQRLQTENVELLKRAVVEFQREPLVFETVRDMTRISYPMVTILSVELDDPDARECANQLLDEMHAPTARQDHPTASFRDFHDAIKTKITLVNWNWLETMFEEFCVGQEHALVAFVALQHRAISIIPVRPVLAPSTKRRVKPQLPVTVPIEHVERPRACPRVKSEPQEDFASVSSVTPRPPMPSCALTLAQRRVEDRDTLYVELCAVESQEPWMALYGVSKAELPPVACGHAWLERNLSRFWNKHARAVWERNFWFRYAPDHTHKLEQHERTRRQDKAVQNYEHTVLVPCYEHFGAQFFVDLDARDERASWWWYRQPVVDIVRLCHRDGLATSVAYLRSQSNARFPERPLGCELHTEKHHADGRSMWSPRDKYQFITDEINELKRHQR